jgi:hypothetical protein
MLLQRGFPLPPATTQKMHLSLRMKDVDYSGVKRVLTLVTDGENVIYVAQRLEDEGMRLSSQNKRDSCLQTGGYLRKDIQHETKLPESFE